MESKRRGTLLVLCAAALVGCAGEEGEELGTPLEEPVAVDEPATGATAVPARAILFDAQGDTVGTAVLEQAPQGVRLAVDVAGLRPGEHGIHLHAVGRCEPPDFSSAGGHLNPDQMQHGFEDPRGPHMGDLRNLTVGEDGTARQTLENERATFDALFDADGTALVIHAQPDDYRTDPSGSSGDRVACGVLGRE